MNAAATPREGIAIAINVMYEQWAPGVAPGIGPMGNPLPRGVDHQAISWATYGSRTGIWSILETLRHAGVSASVYASGILSETAPDSIAAVVNAGHELCGHSWTQDLVPTLLAEEEEREMIRRCVAGFERASGAKPLGWISPRCTPSADTARLLAEQGFEWFGDVFDADLPYRMNTGSGELTALPFGMEVNDLPMTIRYGRPIRELVDDFRTSLEARRSAGAPGLLDVTVHAHIGGRPEGIAALGEILEVASAADDCWIGTRAEIARALVPEETTQGTGKDKK